MDVIQERMAVLRAHLDQCRKRQGAADVELRKAEKALEAAKQWGSKSEIQAASRRLAEAGQEVDAARMAEAKARYLAGE